MKLLGMCVAMAIVTGVAAGPRMVSAQALGEAATLSAGVSTAGTSGRSLGSSIGRAMGSQGSRISSTTKTSTSGGVITLHWSRTEMQRSQRATHTRTPNKTTGDATKAQQGFVIYGADPQNADPDADPDAAPAPQPKAATNKGSSTQANKAPSRQDVPKN